jgi:hypothetical protein
MRQSIKTPLGEALAFGVPTKLDGETSRCLQRHEVLGLRFKGSLGNGESLGLTPLTPQVLKDEEECRPVGGIVVKGCPMVSQSTVLPAPDCMPHRGDFVPHPSSHSALSCESVEHRG